MIKFFIPLSILLSLIFVKIENKENASSSTESVKAKEALAYCKKNNFDTSICFLVNMNIHSGKNRFFVWDFSKEKITHSGLCCHGMGKGSTCDNPVFSNAEGSKCTSLGKYKIGARGYSNWGIHINYKMHGLEKTNNNALARIVVLHSYELIPSSEIYPDHLPLGWSFGCPVISNKLMTSLDGLLKVKKKPVLLWIYN